MIDVVDIWRLKWPDKLVNVVVVVLYLPKYIESDNRSDGKQYRDEVPLCRLYIVKFSPLISEKF